jgi:hypothetical protein
MNIYLIEENVGFSHQKLPFFFFFNTESDHKTPYFISINPSVWKTLIIQKSVFLYSTF